MAQASENKPVAQPHCLLPPSAAMLHLLPSIVAWEASVQHRSAQPSWAVDPALSPPSHLTLARQVVFQLLDLSCSLLSRPVLVQQLVRQGDAAAAAPEATEK